MSTEARGKFTWSIPDHLLNDMTLQNAQWKLTPLPVLNSLADQIHAENRRAGWWDDCKEWLDHVANDTYLLGTKIALIHSEVSEMMEGLRKGLPDDHLPDRSMEEVEAADIFIRLLDYCGARGLDIDGAVAEKRAYNARRADHSAEGRASLGGKKF